MDTSSATKAGARSGPTVAEALAVVVPASLWFGLVTGLSEVVLRSLRRQFMGRFSMVGQHVLWMAPLADLLIFGTLGVLFYVVIRWKQDARLARVAVTLFAFLAGLAVLMMYHPLHPWARPVVAAGLAVQVGRLATSWHPEFLRVIQVTVAWPIVLWRLVVRRTRRGTPDHSVTTPAPTRRDFLVGAGTTLGALAAGVHVTPAVREWRALRRTPPAPGTPSVLFIVLDTVRAASLSLYGHARDTTPELKRLAARGVVFSRAYSHSPWTLPSHGSFFSGCYPHELSGTWHTALDSAQPLLAEKLTAAGFATAGFVANTNYCSYESGLNRGFLHFEDYTVSGAELLKSSVLAGYVSDMPVIARRRKFDLLGRQTAAEVNDRFVAWMDRVRNRPFFAFLNYFDAHAPYLPPPPFDTKFGPAVERSNMRHEFGHRWTSDQFAAELSAYEGAVSYLDAEIGRLVATLETRGLLEQTLIVITSDHGELLGEQGLMDHANGLYAPLLHVPLMMLWPGRVPAGAVVDRPVGLRHLPATILDLAGLDAAPLRGRSLAGHWQNGSGPAGNAEPILSSLEQGIRVEPHWRNAKGRVDSIIAGDRHYIRNADGSEELYDLVRDPGEANNLAASADLGELRQTLARLLAEGSRDQSAGR